ncbi:zinc finger, C4 type [Onchocerca flexuosa]|uniref:Zinc finger, C4 type n=1 Tax=Onchocerca flexuosa TaxID=387005 RepID=A0A238BU41_9BILA|nr:zinc finger, C4 type [Onchocerca flexuosa]
MSPFVVVEPVIAINSILSKYLRSVRPSMKYECKDRKECIVDVARRNHCQACRFRKCLAKSMNPCDTTVYTTHYRLFLAVENKRKIRSHS